MNPDHPLPAEHPLASLPLLRHVTDAPEHVQHAVREVFELTAGLIRITKIDSGKYGVIGPARAYNQQEIAVMVGAIRQAIFVHIGIHHGSSAAAHGRVEPKSSSSSLPSSPPPAASQRNGARAPVAAPVSTPDPVALLVAGTPTTVPGSPLSATPSAHAPPTTLFPDAPDVPATALPTPTHTATEPTTAADSVDSPDIADPTQVEANEAPAPTPKPPKPPKNSDLARVTVEYVRSRKGEVPLAELLDHLAAEFPAWSQRTTSRLRNALSQRLKGNIRWKLDDQPDGTTIFRFLPPKRSGGLTELHFHQAQLAAFLACHLARTPRMMGTVELTAIASADPDVAALLPMANVTTYVRNALKWCVDMYGYEQPESMGRDLGWHFSTHAKQSQASPTQASTNPESAVADDEEDASQTDTTSPPERELILAMAECLAGVSRDTPIPTAELVERVKPKVPWFAERATTTQRTRLRHARSRREAVSLGIQAMKGGTDLLWFLELETNSSPETI